MHNERRYVVTVGWQTLPTVESPEEIETGDGFLRAAVNLAERLIIAGRCEIRDNGRCDELPRRSHLLLDALTCRSLFLIAPGSGSAEIVERFDDESRFLHDELFHNDTRLLSFRFDFGTFPIMLH